jgi:hypothetical protein
MPVRFSRLLDAFKFVIASDFDENHAFIQRDRRDICKSETSGVDELPHDVEDGTKYSAIPTTRPRSRQARGLGLCKRMLQATSMRFGTCSPRKALMPKFKALLARGGALARRYSFEERTTERVLRK